jgi:glycosidase
MLVVSTLISSAPTMIYFGQEVGEAGNENGGFGTRSRTSIFDYVGVPNHQRWMNGGKFDGGQLSQSEKELRDFYSILLNFSTKSSALMGNFQEIQSTNRYKTTGYDDYVYSFVRWSNSEKLIVVSNFSADKTSSFNLKIPADILLKWKLGTGEYKIKDQLYGSSNKLIIEKGEGRIAITLKPLESFVFGL